MQAITCNDTFFYSATAFTGYLGEDTSTWEEYDATELMRGCKGVHLPILVDYGTGDTFLENQLSLDAFKEVCKETGSSATIRAQVMRFRNFVYLAVLASVPL